jgi:DNA-binding NtrC family response regulator
MPSILCIDDEPAVGVVLEQTLAELGHEAILATSVEEGMNALARQSFDLVISDFRMPDATGLDLIERVRQQGLDLPVIIMTAYSSVENAVLSMRHGAADYLTKPLRAEALRLAVHNAIELHRMRRANEDYQRELTALRGLRTIVGESRPLRAVMEVIAAVAPTPATVLIEGESGTGKELFARAIHEQSPRRDRPFIFVNCAALPEGLVESSLFGHERGAFTGATSRSHGAFERAHGGTLLLDEVSEMRLDLQSKLLRAIQEQEFERVGGSQPIKVDVRIVATTNRRLVDEVQAGRFRSDLYYRLSVVPIHTPPLRDRLDDVPVLVDHFVRQSAAQLGIRPPDVPPETIEVLQRHPWPGNVRELANAVERAVILTRGPRLGPSAFAGLASAPGLSPAAPAAPPAPRAMAAPAGAPAPPPVARPDGSAVYNLRELEGIMIARALEATGGHRARAAELLGISERTLRNKLNPPAAR